MKRFNGIIYSHQTGLTADLYLPEDTSSAPLLVFLHGGGIEGGDKTENSASFELLAGHGIAVASADYRLYPSTRFPEFIWDAAQVVAWAYGGCGGHFNSDRIFVGGASAGAYISMLLSFDTTYLSSLGVDRNKIAGFIFDAGQPTVHFNVLRERGEDTRLIRVDEASPMYFLRSPDTGDKTRYLFIAADNDIPCRLEQTRLMIKSMLHLGYPKESVCFKLMEGFGHCAYHGAKADGRDIYSELLLSFICNE